MAADRQAEIAASVAAIMLMALIWVIVGIINVAYAMRKHPDQ